MKNNKTQIEMEDDTKQLEMILDEVVKIDNYFDMIDLI